ncbi:MAG: MoxR family ATPase, partial [Oscillospiraceae bacterium]|nr:MoxR family ATPase [Oscillospiraceae bacterium]
GEFKYIPGAVMHDIVLADEINRTSPKTQASLLEAMEEGQVTVDGKTYPLSPLFMVIATQNPVEHLGTFKLPEAQLDRFLMKISMGYPGAAQEEAEMVNRVLAGWRPQKLQPVVTREELADIKAEAETVKVHPDVMDYAVGIVRSTRESEDITLGASPRAAIALVKAARSRAYLQGRPYVTPEDVSKMIQPVLRHRLTLSSKAELEGRRAKDVLEEAVRQVKAPKL